MRNKNYGRLLLLSVLIFILLRGCYCEGSELLSSIIIKNAITELGNGEEGANNKGHHIKRYMKERENMSWCAGFVSYVLEKSEVKQLGYNYSAKQIYNKAKKLGWEVKEPQAGDLIIFWRDNPKSWKGHIGIIEEVRENIIIVIEGNKGKYPAKVNRFIYNKSDIPKLLGYIRISK